MATRAELLEKNEIIRKHVEAAASGLDALCKEHLDPKSPTPLSGMLGMTRYECHRKFEEAMHRVNDAMAILMQVSEEAVEEAAAAGINKTLADGNPLHLVKG